MTEKKKKSVPCEECRDQKRKCNGESPCERCGKFNLSCVYTSTRSPRDEEYLDIARSASLIQQINVLDNQIKDIEESIQTIKLYGGNSMIMTSPDMSLPSLVDDKSISSFEETSSVICNASVYHNSMFERPTKRTKLIASDGFDINAILSSSVTTSESEEQENQAKVKPWTLTFQKGNICINTNVTTHADLLNNLHHMMGTVELLSTIPAYVRNNLEQNSLLGVMNALIRKKYGKTHCKNVAKSVRIFITPDLSSVNTVVVAQSPDTIQTTTSKLLRAYLQCQHLQQLAIHARTFIRLFIDRAYPLEDSPAAMALCAAICTFRCKHVADCLPSISLVEYGKFYFDRARELLSDLFDQFDLETFTSYTFMTIYKLTISHSEEALLYADMAERIAVVLEPKYDAIMRCEDGSVTMDEKGEAVHYRRLLNHLHRVLTFEQVSRITKPNQLKFLVQDLPFCTLMHMGEGKWELAEDDSIQEKWFVQMHGYILQLQRSGHEASRAAQSCDLDQLVGLIGHQVEMSMRHWYNNILPAEFKLSLPLFDSTTPCQEFYTTLDRECAHSAIPVLTTLALYEEWIVLSQAYLPKNLPSPENDWRRINEVWNGGPTCIEGNNKKWQRRIDKLMELRTELEFDGTDQEFLVTVNSMLGNVESRINNGILKMGVHAAISTIRLIKYLRSRPQDCYFDIKVLINAWQILLNVSRLQPILPQDVLAMIPRVHKNLTNCMNIVNEELKLQPYQGKVGDYVTVMERELRSQVVEEEDCDCVACPNA
ncbi:unnamed protein product [Mucor hiemalis]